MNQKVICIDDYIQPHMREEISRDFQQWVTKGETYTIREILENDGIVEGVLLEEVVNNPIYFSKTIQRVQEPAFSLHRFAEIESEEYNNQVKKETVIYD